jgi:hypothetical protein
MINPESLLILCKEVLLFFYISLDSERDTSWAGGWVGKQLWKGTLFTPCTQCSLRRMAFQGCLIFRLKLADELEERQRRIIQTREKTGSQDNWSGQDYSLADI